MLEDTNKYGNVQTFLLETLCDVSKKSYFCSVNIELV